MPHELFLTASQTTEIRNSFANIMSTNIKLSKTQMSKIIQSGGFLCNMLGNLGKKVMTNFAIPLTRDNLPGLVSNLASDAINKCERIISGKGAIRAEKGFTLSIIHKIIKRFKCINWWYYWNSKTWNKKQEGGYLPALLAPLAASLVQPVISSVVKGISGRRGRRAQRGYMDNF